MLNQTPRCSSSLAAVLLVFSVTLLVAPTAGALGTVSYATFGHFTPIDDNALSGTTGPMPIQISDDILFGNGVGGPGSSGHHVYVADAAPAMAHTSVEAYTLWGAGSVKTMAAAYVGSTDLIVSGAGASVLARLNLTIDSTWSYTSNLSGGSFGGVEIDWTLYSSHSSENELGLTGTTILSGSASTCYTTPWVSVPVGVAISVGFGLETAAVGGNGAGGGSQDASVTPGCSPFIEFQEAGYTYDSAELGIEGGAFVPEPAMALLMTIGALGVALPRR